MNCGSLSQFVISFCLDSGEVSGVCLLDEYVYICVISSFQFPPKKPVATMRE